MACRLWSGSSNDGCLLMERLRIPLLFLFMRLDVSVSLQSHWNPKDGGSNTSKKNNPLAAGQINFPVTVRASRQKAKASFSHILYMGSHWKVCLKFRIYLSTSNGAIKKTPHRHAQLLGFQSIPDVVKLTKIINHTLHFQMHKLELRELKELPRVSKRQLGFLYYLCLAAKGNG